MKREVKLYLFAIVGMLVFVLLASASKADPRKDLQEVLHRLKGEAVPPAVTLKVAKAFVFAYEGEWENLVTSAGYVIETPSEGEERDVFSVGTYDDAKPPVFTPAPQTVINKGLAIHALNRLGHFTRVITSSQWRDREAVAQAGDTPARVKAKGKVAAKNTADQAAGDRSLEKRTSGRRRSN